MFIRNFIILLVLLCASRAHAQKGVLSNERIKKIPITQNSIQLDSAIVVEGSLHIFNQGQELPISWFTIKPDSALISWSDTLAFDTLVFRYKVFPKTFSQSIRHKPLALYSTELKSDNYKPYVLGNKPSESIFDDKDIQKSGSISRGIAFGNSQNLSVNSNLNLQLSGRLTERFQMLASVTDDNIPIQPAGNTQQLQDFDQVFIQVYDDHTKIIAGDFILKRPAGYFMNYYKRAQGAYASWSTPTSTGLRSGKLSVEASASISKGRFARNTIQGVEGNQGPYRLSGADGELFVIVLAGTEQVYIDGRLLQRGLDKDYVIDYNAAEIIFTPRQLITKDRRIVVEFQYSEKRYARPLLQTSIQWQNQQTQAYLNVYSENDARNQPLQQALTNEDKAIMAAAGDDLLSAVRSGIDSVGFSNNLVMYALIDSLGYDSILVYSVDSLAAKYRVTFSNVGAGKGDYVEDGFTANGRKFKWVVPVISGNQILHQGNYAPVVVLSTPKKTQLITAGFTHTWNNNMITLREVSMEGGLSLRDLNTFSSIDQGDDIGYAYKFSFKQDRPGYSSSPIKPVDPGHRGLRPTGHMWKIGYEYTGMHFNQIERFREVEFARNWNILQLNQINDQHIGGAEYTISRFQRGQVTAGADAFLWGTNYEGFKARIQSNLAKSNSWKLGLVASALITRGAVESQFIRHKSDLSKNFGKWRVYFRDEHEHNLFYREDTLATNSYQFYDWETGVGSADTTKQSITFYYRDRIDRRPGQLQLTNAARADQYGVVATFKTKKDGRLLLNASNRRLRIQRPDLISQAPENTLVGRIEYQFKWKEGFIQSNTYYEIGSGLEQRREFIYLEVPAGQGVYVWNDYNQDGVKDLNEFEVAAFSYEANYIRSSVQTNDYVRIYTNQFSQTFQINPSRIFKGKTAWENVLNRFQNQTSLRADRKTTQEDNADRFNPFLTEVADSTLLAMQGLFRNILFFNKAHPVFGMDYTFQYTRNKNLLSNGFESRGDDYHLAGVRWTFIRSWTIYFESKQGKRLASSDFLTGRNYEIKYWSVQPKLTWQPGTSSRINFLAQYTSKNNTLGSEGAIIQKMGADITLNSMEKGSFQAEFSYFKIDYNGTSNNSLSFDMLEGLTNGNNFTWTATVQRTIAKNLQINLTYNGRKPETIRTIHSGSVQLRAFF